MITGEPSKYLTPLEAARYVRISVSTLAKWRVYGGGPPFIRIGRVIRYSRGELDAYMAARIARSTSDLSNRGKKRRGTN
jgi:excisionase family DNA binding protein